MTASQECSLFIQFLNLPPGDCPPGVQPAYIVPKPIPKRLSAKDSACSYGKACNLFISFLNLSPRDCQPKMQPVHMVSKPIPRGLPARGAVCLYRFGTYLWGTVDQGCSLLLWFPNQPPGDCWQGLQPVFIASKPTFRILSARGAACLHNFRTYLQRTVDKGCSLCL